eukprot:2805532-Pleurochrysis_carterae.AAC.2
MTAHEKTSLVSSHDDKRLCANHETCTLLSRVVSALARPWVCAVTDCARARASANVGTVQHGKEGAGVPK